MLLYNPCSGSLDSSGSRAEGFNCNPEDTFLNFATCNYDLISTDECSSPNIVGVACISSSKYIIVGSVIVHLFLYDIEYDYTTKVQSTPSEQRCRHNRNTE